MDGSFGPTKRGKGTKWRVVVDGQGLPPPLDRGTHFRLDKLFPQIINQI